MGQKVNGYRRNVPYGKETVRILPRTGSDQGKMQGRSWIFQVNPRGKVGWNRGTSGRTETGYGEGLNEGRRIRKEVEERRKVFGAVTNGLGRKGTKDTGYRVHGEYTYGDPRNKKDRGGRGPEVEGKKPSRYKTYEEGKRRLGRERLQRKLESQRKVKLDRERRDLKKRRREFGLEGEKKERLSVMGVSTKRTKPVERAEAVALSGRIPTGQRRTTLVARELEQGRNHMEVRRNLENLRKHHAKSSEHGRKKRGEPMEDDVRSGYYGYQVVVKGPLGGARRTIKHVIHQGTVPLGTKKARRTTGFEHAKTSIGTIGVKRTYCYGRG